MRLVVSSPHNAIRINERIMLGKIERFYNEHSLTQKKFLFYVIVLCFLICGEASITKPIANAFYLSTYGAKNLVYVWLFAVPCNLCIVLFYNRYVFRFGFKKMLWISIALAITINLFASAYHASFGWVAFVLYLWKDIYIMLLFQQLWSLIHATFDIDRAKYMYGVFYGVGGLGSCFVSLIPGCFAVSLGSHNLLFCTIPIYLIIGWFFSKAVDCQGNNHALKKSEFKKNINGAWSIFKQSRSLVIILVIVLCMQLTATMIDMKFNIFVEKQFIHTDLRTQFMGQFFFILFLIIPVIQFFGAYTSIQFLGIRLVHFLIPSVMCLSFIVNILYPNMYTLCFLFGLCKTLDYSLFGVAKELLYIPLTFEEKVKGKAVIDIFVYRSSKAVASFIIIGLALWGLQQGVLFDCIVLSILGLWIVTVNKIEKEEKQVLA